MNFYGQFPSTRLRRLRTYPWLRDMVQETWLHPSDLILPIFIRTPDASAEIESMPGIRRWTLEELPQIIDQVLEVGIPAIALFPLTPFALKTVDGAEACNPENLICKAIRAIKKMAPDIGIITDVALDPYTSHGHDGVWNGHIVDNDQSLKLLTNQALVQAEAGADVIAPSDMMDGRVAAIRHALDSNNFQNCAILSYAAKYASSFYGPFREAVGAIKLPPNPHGKAGDKKTYQMNPANSDEALREVALDLQEGADMVMVKPGLPYLDVIARVKQTFSVPIFAYQVSGEYALIKAAAAQGWVDEQAVMKESLIALKRAGSVGIFTYAALEVARDLILVYSEVSYNNAPTKRLIPSRTSLPFNDVVDSAPSKEPAQKK
ncbi:MAG: porphobilinogen synthase [Alphaproteobacteria bacterium]|nr:porphobilinogen synthase [Alphaproteobacteria bacterium]